MTDVASGPHPRSGRSFRPIVTRREPLRDLSRRRLPDREASCCHGRRRDGFPLPLAASILRVRMALRRDFSTDPGPVHVSRSRGETAHFDRPVWVGAPGAAPQQRSHPSASSHSGTPRPPATRRVGRARPLLYHRTRCGLLSLTRDSILVELFQWDGVSVGRGLGTHGAMSVADRANRRVNGRAGRRDGCDRDGARGRPEAER